MGMEREETEGAEAAAPAVRVLVVDDSALDRKMVERLLLMTKGAFEVISVDSGKKAIEVLGLDRDEAGLTLAVEGRAVDLILTDYCMPEMNGYDLLRKVKGHDVSRSIPIVIMSSENDPQRINSCCASGAEEFILKPLQAVHIQKLRSYARIEVSVPASPTGSNKRKLPSHEIMAENGEQERQRPCLTGVAAA